MIRLIFCNFVRSYLYGPKGKLFEDDEGTSLLLLLFMKYMPLDLIKLKEKKVKCLFNAQVLLCAGEYAMRFAFQVIYSDLEN